MRDSSSNPKELFLDALELEGEARRELLDGLSPQLRERVLELLEAHGALSGRGASAGTWLSPLPGLPPVSQLLADFDAEPVADLRLGPFRLLEEIGRGGFGRVWLAEQSEPVRRQVALKMLKAGLDSEEITARFHAERQALAMMDHPNIARIFDGGASKSGLPWFAMEYVDGAPITDYCEQRALPLGERLRLFLDVCRAVQHAHQKGIIHRDIKPNNVMVSEVDGTPMPKVIDFGIAKAIEESLTADAFQTQGGQLMGTPAWMSPEQVGHAADVDTRADIYSLGALLYQLLTDRQAYSSPSGETPPLPELLSAVRERDPIKPSLRLAHAQRPGAVRARELRGDLDWITMRCLEKDRERRYSSAALLVSDIERHLAGDTVSAGPPTLGYRLSKLGRRYRGALAFTAALILMLSTGVIVASGQARRAQLAETGAVDEARRARLEGERYQEVAGLLEHLLMSIDPLEAKGKDPALLLDILARAQRDVDQRAPRPEVEATLRRVIGGAYLSLARFDESQRQLARALELRGALYSDAHLDTLSSLEELGGLYMLWGRPADALPYLERAHAGRVELLGPEHPDTLHAAQNVATTLMNIGLFEQAIERLVPLERWYEQHLGLDDDTTLLVINNLALAFDKVGRDEEALARYEMLLERQRKREGPTGARALSAMNNLGTLYVQLGRYAEAQPLLEQALEAKRKILPEGHPSLLTGFASLASLARKTGDVGLAERLYDEALEMGRAAHGPDEHHVLVLEYHQTEFFLELGLVEEAREQIEGLLPRIEAQEAPTSDFLGRARTLAARIRADT